MRVQYLLPILPLLLLGCQNGDSKVEDLREECQEGDRDACVRLDRAIQQQRSR
jgi:hypothetical protein